MVLVFSWDLLIKRKYRRSFKYKPIRGTVSSYSLIQSKLFQIEVPFFFFLQNCKKNTTHHSYLLSVGDNDDQYGGDAADNDNNCQSQQRPLCVAYSLHSFLHTSHHFRGSDLQNPTTRREEGLELFIDVQEFTVEKPLDEKHNDVTETMYIWQKTLHNNLYYSLKTDKT